MHDRRPPYLYTESAPPIKELMDDLELTREFIGVERTEKSVRVLVQEVFWDGSHTPTSKWTEAATLAPDTSQPSIHKKILEILEDRRYFSVCVACSERQPKGWMHDEKTCHSCAERNHGVVY